MKIYLIGGVTYTKDLYDYFKRTAIYLRSCGHTVALPLLYPEGVADGSTIHAIEAYARKAIENADAVYVDINDVDYFSVGRIIELSEAFNAGKQIIISAKLDKSKYRKLLENKADAIFKTHDMAMKYFYNLKD